MYTYTDYASELAAQKGIKLDIRTQKWERANKYTCRISMPGYANVLAEGRTLDEALVEAAFKVIHILV